MNTLVILATAFALGPGASAYAADGAALFQSNCASCHGASGAGDTPVGKAMNIPSIQGKSAANVVQHVNEASNHAVPRGKLSAEELEAVARHIAAWETPMRQKRAERVGRTAPLAMKEGSGESAGGASF